MTALLGITAALLGITAALLSITAALLGITAALLGITAALLSITAALLGITAALLSITAALLGITAALLGITAALLGITAALLSITAALLSITAALLGITAALLGITAALLSITAALLSITAALLSITAALLGITAALLGITAALLSITAALLGITAALLGITAALLGITAALLRITAALLSITAALLSITAALLGITVHDGASPPRPDLSLSSGGDVLAPRSSAPAAIGRARTAGIAGARSPRRWRRSCSGSSRTPRSNERLTEEPMNRSHRSLHLSVAVVTVFALTGAPGCASPDEPPPANETEHTGSARQAAIAGEIQLIDDFSAGGSTCFKRFSPAPPSGTATCSQTDTSGHILGGSRQTTFGATGTSASEWASLYIGGTASQSFLAVGTSDPVDGAVTMIYFPTSADRLHNVEGVTNPSVAFAFDYSAGAVVNACIAVYSSNTWTAVRCEPVDPSNAWPLTTVYVPIVAFDPANIQELWVQITREGPGGEMYQLSRIAYASN